LECYERCKWIENAVWVWQQIQMNPYRDVWYLVVGDTCKCSPRKKWHTWSVGTTDIFVRGPSWWFGTFDTK
jgi:hypothetical protein